MRLAKLESDFWQLRSGEDAHRAAPDTFWIPALRRRESLKRGQAAKLIFEIEATEPDGTVSSQGERMWVIVAEKIGDIFIGRLANQPVCLEPSDDAYLGIGAEVPFRAEHVIDIDDPPPEYGEGQLAQLPARRWPRDEAQPE
jgi:hypothetical protein